MHNIFLCLHFRWGNQVLKKSLPDPPLELSFLEQINPYSILVGCYKIDTSVISSYRPSTCISFPLFLYSCNSPQVWMHTSPKWCNNTWLCARTLWRRHWMVLIWARNSSHSRRARWPPEQEGCFGKQSVVYQKSKSQHLSLNKGTRQQIIEKKERLFLKLNTFLISQSASSQLTPWNARPLYRKNSYCVPNIF